MTSASTRDFDQVKCFAERGCENGLSKYVSQKLDECGLDYHWEESADFLA